MHGPKPFGTWTKDGRRQAYGMLTPTLRYRVTAAFTDYDRAVHPVGETWTYLTYKFLPHDDGLSLIVSLDGHQEWHIRLQDRSEEQGDVVRHLGNHIAEITGQRVAPPLPPSPFWRRWFGSRKR